MSDEIREAFEKLWDTAGELLATMCKGNIKQFAKDFYYSGFKAGAASRDDEITELVEALKVLLTNNELGEVESQRLGLPRMTEARQKARSTLSRYTKTTCPECDGWKKTTSCPECGNSETIYNDSMGEGYRVCSNAECKQEYYTNVNYCPTCKGQEYKWERKG